MDSTPGLKTQESSETEKETLQTVAVTQDCSETHKKKLQTVAFM